MAGRSGRVLERTEQAHIVQLLRSIGAAVYVLGHPSPRDGRVFRGTGQTAGIPDLYAFLPASQSPHRTRVCPVWIEVKAAGGRLRPEQVAFRQSCLAAGHVHLVGGLDVVMAWLIERGYLTVGQVPHYRTLPEA